MTREKGLTMNTSNKELREMIINVKKMSGGTYGGYLTEKSIADILAWFKRSTERVGREKKECPVCKGAGVIWSERWQEFHKLHPVNDPIWDKDGGEKMLLEFFNVSSIKQLPQEEPNCDECGGSGWLYVTLQDIIVGLDPTHPMSNDKENKVKTSIIKCPFRGMEICDKISNNGDAYNSICFYCAPITGEIEKIA